jgi:predicted DNA-binding protein
METLSFQAPKAMKAELERVAKKLDRSKAYIIRQALTEYMEDLKDYVEVKSYKATYNPEKNVPWEEIKRRHKLK